MPSVQDEQIMRNLRRNLAAQGVDANIDITRREKRQWYRADGTPLPNLQPVDDYNRAVFEGNGWTLVPPSVPAQVKPEGTLSPIEREIEKERAKNEQVVPTPSPITEAVDRESQKHHPIDVPNNFLIAAESGIDRPACTEIGCGYVATGNTKKMQAARLYKHTYGAYSKHKKEKD